MKVSLEHSAPSRVHSSIYSQPFVLLLAPERRNERKLFQLFIDIDGTSLRRKQQQQLHTIVSSNDFEFIFLIQYKYYIIARPFQKLIGNAKICCCYEFVILKIFTQTITANEWRKQTRGARALRANFFPVHLQWARAESF